MGSRVRATFKVSSLQTYIKRCVCSRSAEHKGFLHTSFQIFFVILLKMATSYSSISLVIFGGFYVGKI